MQLGAAARTSILRHHSLTWGRFLKTLRHFFADMSWKAIFWFGLLLVLLLSVNGLNVLNSFVGRDFITAIAQRNWHRYTLYAVLYAGVFAGSTVVAVLTRFSEERLRLLWRTWLTQTLIERYLANHSYYRLKAREEIDNPDQRMTDDVKSYTQTTLAFFLLTLNATITSLAFLGVLWTITPWLVLVAVLYATIGSVATILLGRPLVLLNNLQLKKEADLRYYLIRVRETAETIAAMRAEPVMRGRLLGRLDEVVSNSRKIIAVTRNLGFFTNGYNYMIQLIPLLIVAPLYMRGAVEFGVVTQSAMAFSQVLGALSLIITQFETLSTFAAVSERLNMIAEGIERAQAPSSTAIQVVEDDARVAFEGLTLWTPKERRLLIRDLSLSLPQGSSLLVTGPNTTGKSALFLATAGIWEEGEGWIFRPNHDAMHFVPQRRFSTRGTLREQLLLTIPDGEYTDDQLLDALREVGLEPALERVGGLDIRHDLTETLSVGELHLLALARLLLVRPRFAFVDRVVEALSPNQVEHLYRLLSESSITYLSIAEHEGLLRYHDRVLELFDDGGWRITPAQEMTRV